MSRENVEALKAIYERWGSGNFWTPEIFDPDIDWGNPWEDEFPIQAVPSGT